MDIRCRISLFGGLAVEQAGRVITRFRSHQTGALLAYLAYHNQRSHPRELLIELLWPECDPPTGRSRLSVALSSLRHQLEPPGVPAGAVIQADRTAVGVNPAVIATDVGEFEALLRAAGRAGSGIAREQRLKDAVELYRGPLLPGHYAEWIPPEQQRLSELFFHAIRDLVRHREQVGDLPGALQYAIRAVAADRLREEAHHEVIRLSALAGQPAMALRRLQELERILEEELGASPSEATRRLAREIEQADETAAPRDSLERGADHPPLRKVVEHGHEEETGGAEARPLVLPTGTVTFLIIDVAEAAALHARWEEAFDTALTGHHAVLRQAFRRFGGREVKAAGPAFIVAFAAAGDALICAIAGQRALAARSWPAEISPLQIRMALHTGDVELEDGEYRGPALDHAARILVAGHDGQILCSEITAGLVRQGGTGVSDADLQLVDLGVYRLRGLPVPIRLFQVDPDDMPRRQFPPLAAPAAHNGSLPLHFNRFFGRRVELAQLRELLDRQARLVTLTGPGGSGKTRLALELASELMERFQGAVWFVPLADLSDPRRVVETIRDALRLRRSPDLTPLEQVVDTLSQQPSLLVLDNFEHLVQDGAATVRALLEQAPSLQCLVASRQRLDLAGEREFPIRPLPIPIGAASPEQLTLFESVQLFVDRAQAVRPDFQVTSSNAPAVAELCQRLEGIPLALELAAARAQVLTPAQMLAQLGQRFEFLVSRRRDAIPRHRTLRAAIEWSYQLLMPELQRFFTHLCVFRGGWSLEAAETVCHVPLALDHLEQLRECSLILRGEEHPDGIRFRMLETLREFGEEHWEAEEGENLAREHAGYFLALAEQEAPFRQLEPEVDNFRAAFRWEIDREPELALQLAVALAAFWQQGRYFSEGREALARALEKAVDAPISLRREALSWSGRLAHNEGEFAQAKPYFEEALALCQQEGDPQNAADAMDAVAGNAMRRGDYPRARAHYEERLAFWQEQGDEEAIAGYLGALAWLASREGDHAPIRALLEESLAMERRLGHDVTLTLHNLGIIVTELGDYATARALLEESIARRREASRAGPNEAGIHLGLIHLGWVALRQNEYSEALSLFKEALETSRRLGSKHLIVECLHGLAELASVQGPPERAVRLLGASEGLCAATGFAFWKDAGKLIPPLREALGETAFTAAWEAGRALRWREAATYALGE
jgi:predicted ATPase/DNA-binding SARP family transcriptional activator